MHIDGGEAGELQCLRVEDARQILHGRGRRRCLDEHKIGLAPIGSRQCRHNGGNAGLNVKRVAGRAHNPVPLIQRGVGALGRGGCIGGGVINNNPDVTCGGADDARALRRTVVLGGHAIQPRTQLVHIHHVGRGHVVAALLDAHNIARRNLHKDRPVHVLPCLGKHVVDIKPKVHILGAQRQLLLAEADANRAAVRALDVVANLRQILHVAERETAHDNAGRNRRGCLFEAAVDREDCQQGNQHDHEGDEAAREWPRRPFPPTAQ